MLECLKKVIKEAVMHSFILTGLFEEGIRITCLKHLLKADDGMLGGAIWRRTPPLALKSGITSINTVTETSPKHKTSAFSTLENKNISLPNEKCRFLFQTN